jgi:hypothetical protein
MAKINVKFNDINYQIDESAFTDGKEKVIAHLSGDLKGTGASISFDGTAYDVDSTKLTSAKTKFVSHLATIAGGDKTIIIAGVEYGIDSAKVAKIIADLEALLAGDANYYTKDNEFGGQTVCVSDEDTTLTNEENEFGGQAAVIN